MAKGDYRYKVVLVDYDEDLFAPRGWEAEKLAEVGASWVPAQHRSPEAIVKAAADADVVMVQSVRPLLTAEVIDCLDMCRLIIRVGIGYDSVDVEAATRQGILVSNVPGYCVEEVAEHTVALVLAAWRFIGHQDRALREGVWDRRLSGPARRLNGRPLGLLGFGNIGRQVAWRGKGLGLEVIAHDPYVSDQVFTEHGVVRTGLEELLRRSDILSLHLPLNASTRHILGAKELALLPPGAVVVNTSRGELIDQRALVAALQSGHLAAAGLDVFEEEPIPDGDPILELEQVILTPHTGGYSVDSADDLYRQACQITAQLLRHEVPDAVVNPGAVEMAKVRWGLVD
jgi:D-3-phosphoglycerate dehydrogenase